MSLRSKRVRSARRLNHAIESLEARRFLSASAVKYLDTDTASSLPRYLTAGPGGIYFAANDGVHGTELWKSDGTSAGTSMVADIVPGANGSSPSMLTAAGSDLFFTTKLGGLWVTDGSTQGTIELNTGTPTGSMVAVGSRVFYSASDSIAGLELWSSDGTVAGTGRVADINPGSANSSPTSLVADNGLLYFIANDGTHGSELWQSNGTAAGTSMVSDIDPGTASGVSGSVAVAGGILYFSGNDGTHGPELWRSNGTAAGTYMVADLVSGTGGTGPEYFSTVGNNLYFFDTDASNTTRLYYSNGTAAGTTALMTVSLFSSGTAYPLGNGTSVIGLNLTSPATSGLYLLSGANTPSLITSSVTSIYSAASEMNGTLYFTIFYPYELYLWKTNGTTAGTTEITSVDMPSAGIDNTSAGFGFLNWNGAIYTAASPLVGNDQPVGQELCEINSSSGSVTAVADINQVEPYGSSPQFFTQIGNLDYFLVNNTTLQLWRTDGTASGTYEVADTGVSTIGADNANGTPGSLEMVGVNGSVVFIYSDLVFTSTGRAGNLHLLGNYANGINYVGGLVSNGQAAFYFAYDSSGNPGLFVTDGTTATEVANVSNNGDSYQSADAILNGVVYFSSSTAAAGDELWRSDGTAAGTYQVADIMPGSNGSNPTGFTAIGSYIYFDATSPDGSSLPYRTDGTTSGTVELSSIASVELYTTTPSYGVMPPTFVGANGIVYFSASDAAAGGELWRTDGTPAGTEQVLDLVPGSVGSMPADLTAFGNEVAFVGHEFSGSSDADLYVSNGTAAGTVQLTTTLGHSLNPSNYSAYYDGPGQLTVAGSTLFFFASDGYRPAGLYRSDGTPQGTVRVDAGNTSLIVENPLITVGDTLSMAPLGSSGVVFAASNGVHGFEPWFAPSGPALSAFAGRGYSTLEGQSVTLSGSASEAASGDPIVKYEWDFNYSYSTGFQANATGPTAVYTGIAGPATIPVALRVTSASGETSVDITQVTVVHVPPTVTVSGSGTAQVGIPYTLALSTSADTTPITGWRIDWGDGTVDTLAGDPSSDTHTYLLAKSWTITAVARDQYGTYSTGGQTVSALDPSFGTGGQLLDSAGNGADRQMFVFPDGKILTAGGNGVVALSRYTASGQVDTSFGNGGHLTVNPTGGNETVVAMAAAPGNEVVIAGTTVTAGGTATWFAVRVNENGQLDTSFGSNGVVIGPVAPTAVITSVAVGTDGRVVVAGSLDQGTSAGGVNFFAARLTSTGAVDTTFNGTGWTTVSFGSAADDIAYGVAIAADNSVILAGVGPDQYGNVEVGLAKLTPSGIPDVTFGTAGKVNTGLSTYYTALSIARDVLIQPDGRIVIVGVTAQEQELSAFPSLIAARYTTTGQLDPTFGSVGFVYDSYPEGDFIKATLQPNGEIIALSASFGQMFVYPQLVRITAAGKFDNYFGPSTESGIIPLTSPAGSFDATDLSLTSAGDVLVLANDELGTLLSRYQLDRPSLTVASQPDVSIAGTVFADANGDGTDTPPTDTPIAGATVYIDTNSDGKYEPGEPTATTNSSGNYVFDLLSAGTYTVRLNLPNGAYESSPANNSGNTVSLVSGQGVLGQNFGQTLYGSVSGIVYEDNNANGVYDAGDSPAAGVTVYQDSNNNGYLDPGETTATTNSAGMYSFANLRTGTYVVREILMNNWVQTTPASAGAVSVTITSGLNLSGENFGQTPATISNSGTITGAAFGDLNDNAYKDSSEIGMIGITFFLDLNGDGAWESNEPAVVTDINGNFKFTNIGPGHYRVDEIIPSGYTLTTPIANGYAVTVSAGYNISAGNFGAWPGSTAILSGTILGTAANGTNTPAKAFDSNLSTYFDGLNPGTPQSPNWVGLDLGSDYYITAVGYASRSGYASRMNGGIFQASNTADFSSGVATLYTISSAENPSSTSVTVRQAGVYGAYRYVRYLSQPGTYGDVSELRFVGIKVPSLNVSSGQTSHITAGTTLSRYRSYSSLAIQAGGSAVVDAGNYRQLVQVYGTSSFLSGSPGSWTSLLDLTTNDMDLVGASLATVTDQIRQGFANGSWNGSGGIKSSTAASDTTHLMAVGVITNLVPGSPLFTTLDGMPVAAGDILVRTTYYGDANLDGHVDGSDYSLIDNGFSQHLTGWYNGDFNYDGIINGSDYTLIDNAFNRQGPPILQATSSAQIAAIPAARSQSHRQVVPDSLAQVDSQEKQRSSKQKVNKAPSADVLDRLSEKTVG